MTLKYPADAIYEMEKVLIDMLTSFKIKVWKNSIILKEFPFYKNN